jgi:hypothetical protein
LFTLAWAGLVVGSCDSLPEPTEAIRRWMQCVECDRGELDTVRTAGDAAVPTLRAYLLDGPEPEREDSVRRYLEWAWDTLVAEPSTHVTPIHFNKTLMLQTFLGNLDATYRTRAARALQVIGGRDARAALDSARRLPLRPDVAHVVQAAFDSLPR